MSKYKYAEQMQQLADDCQISDAPWEFWEFKKDGKWLQSHYLPNLEDGGVPYRRKPDTIDINGFKVPKPLASPPSPYTTVYVVNLASISKSVTSETLLRSFKQGRCHLTKESAELHRKALLSFTAEVEL